MSAPATTAARRKTVFADRGPLPSNGLLGALQTHLATLERSQSHLERWSHHESLAGATTTEQIIGRVQGRPLQDDPIDTIGDRALRALILEHTRGDQAATIVCVLAFVPLLRACTDLNEEDLLADLVAALIASLDGAGTTPHPARTIMWAVRGERRRLTSRAPKTERATTLALGEAIWSAQLGMDSTTLTGTQRLYADRDLDDVWGLLLDARRAAVITLEEAHLLAQSYGLNDDSPKHSADLATDLGISAATLRQRTSRAVRKLRTAVADGHLVLQTTGA